MGEASVQVIARFGESVLHVWTGRPDASLDVAALTNGASSSTSKPFFLEGGALRSSPPEPARLAVFGAPLALGDRAVHVVDGLRLEVSYDAPVVAPPRGKIASRVVLGAIASLLAHVAFATSIATSDPGDRSEDGSKETERAAMLARMPNATPTPSAYRVRWTNDVPSASAPALDARSDDAGDVVPAAARTPLVPKRATRPVPATPDHRPPTPPERPPAEHVTTAPSAQGRIDPLAVQRVVNASRGRFQMCVATARQIDPDVTGRVAVSFAISAEGRVTAAVVTETPASGLGACVRSTFESLSFPRPVGGPTRVVYPFAVSPDL